MDERELKHQAVRQYLQTHQLDAVVLSRRCNFSWFTGGARNYVGQVGDVGSSWLVVTDAAVTVVANAIEAPRLRAESFADEWVKVEEIPWPSLSVVNGTFRALINSPRLAVDAPVPALEAPVLRKDFDRLRWVLCEAEIARYRGVCADTVAAVEAVARAATPGQSEYDLAAAVSAELLRHGCLPWTVLVGADERVEKFRHPLPTDKKLSRYFLIVVCAERGGLIANCSRLAYFGRLPAELVAKHQAVANVDAALIGATRPAATLGEIFAIAQAAYAAAGFPDEWRLHHQGGSTGYLPREVKAAPDEPTAVLANQAFAWNPSVTGTKSEDTVLCRGDGCEVLGTSTDWPTLTGRWKDFSLPRPAILEL